MQTSLFREIVAFFLGYKYYANIVWMKGTTKRQLSSFIFSSREAAERHRDSLVTNRSYGYVETISFRSHREYKER